jgi:hypothetical protein
MGLVSRSADGFVLAGALRAELAALPRLARLACRLNVVAAVGAAVAAGNDPVGRHGVDGDRARARWRCQGARGSGAVAERVDQPPPATGSVLAATPGVAVGAAPSDAHCRGLMAKVGSCMAGSSRAGGMQGTYTRQQVVSTLVAADPAHVSSGTPGCPASTRRACQPASTVCPSSEGPDTARPWRCAVCTSRGSACAPHTAFPRGSTTPGGTGKPARWRISLATS